MSHTFLVNNSREIILDVLYHECVHYALTHYRNLTEIRIVNLRRRWSASALPKHGAINTRGRPIYMSAENAATSLRKGSKAIIKGIYADTAAAGLLIKVLFQRDD
jgi:hypothetical protein